MLYITIQFRLVANKNKYMDILTIMLMEVFNEIVFHLQIKKISKVKKNSFKCI